MRHVAFVGDHEPRLLCPDLPVHAIGRSNGWGKYQFFVFLATMQLINSLVQAFFMPNAEEFSELVRMGGLDFALLKPIDTQFLVSLAKFDWSALINFLFAAVLLGYSLVQVGACAGTSSRSCFIRFTFCAAWRFSIA